ncbi:MAG TPA: DNA ligase D [Dongiaceae bacterium]|jgi:bifunctional non-homologous end joining protein LigD|nr:DNA ligase D [Dongiaceae bacterium]
MRRKDKLSLYRKKRDFAITPEPSGAAPAESGGGRYVIQMHDARRLHFDLRLEMDGVYKSWAVTRGPSLDPKDRRLAVEVEDHPIEYGTFEGTIPQGQYGGGTVMLWDRGRWIPEGDPRKGLKKGHLAFEFQGERLKGGYHLVRMADRDEGKGGKARHNWLLMKQSDRWAKPGHGDDAIKNATSVKTGRTMRRIAEGGGPTWNSKDRSEAGMKKNVAAMEADASGKRGKLPAFIEPELTTLVDAPPGGTNWVHEVKFDGYRMGARIENGTVKMITRSGLDWTRKFRAIAKELAKTGIESAWLDGEVVVPDENGLSSFSNLQRALSEGDDRQMVFYLFDLPYLNGQDLRDLPLIQRKQILRDTLFARKRGGALAYSDHHEAEGGDFFKAVRNMGLEGVVSKRKDSPYRSGRGRDWVKAKCIDRDEFVVGGYTPSRAGRGIGSLLVGHHEGKRLVYDGRAGTGFDAKESVALEKKLRGLKRDECPFHEMDRAYKTRGIWVAPTLVAEIEHRGRSSDGLLRQAAFVGLRGDKPARQVDRSDRPRGGAESGEPVVGGIKITHPTRVIDPTTGATKLDLAKYYGRVAETLLLDMADRPVAVVRCPDGITGQTFFQRHPQQTLAGRISTVKDPEDKEQLLCVRNATDLITLVQFGVIEIHPWQTHIGKLDKADRFILDLDPAPDVPFEAVTLAAKLVRKRLEALGLKSIVKTTGGKGLHVIVPLRPAASWKIAKGFAKAIADSLARDEPKIFLATASKAARKGRIYVDYLRNDRGSTAVGAYCARARPGLPVAMPLDWRAVTEDLRPADYNLQTVSLVALPKEWRDAQSWRQGLDAKKLKAVGLAKE